MQVWRLVIAALASPWFVRAVGGASSSSSRHVVVAAAMGYPFPVFKRFVVPLRQTGYTGAVVLFVDERAMPSEIVSLCEHHNVTTRALPGHLVGALPGQLTSAQATPHATPHAAAADPRATAKGIGRYAGYREVCDPAQFDHCFATDFRDVVFQADPFVDLPPGAGLVLAQEYAAVSIGQCKHNSGWIRTCFGERVLARIQGETIVCSGTIMGTPEGFRVLYEQMRRALRLTAQRPRCAMLDGVDQGRFNYL